MPTPSELHEIARMKRHFGTGSANYTRHVRFEGPARTQLSSTAQPQEAANDRPKRTIVIVESVDPVTLERRFELQE